MAVATDYARSMAAGRETVSVIVPVRNERKYIERILRQLINQTIPPGALEILVADGRSLDSTREVVANYAKRYPFIKLLDNPKKIASAGRNLCIRNSTGGVVVVVDGHCDLSNRNYLSTILDLFRSSNADCLGRPQPLEGECRTATQKAIALARSSWIGHNPDSLNFSGGSVYSDPSNVAVAYRRDGLKRFGLFDERFDACEDVELNFRAFNSNMACFFSEDIRLNYVPRESLAGLFRQMKRYGRGRIRLIRKHAETYSHAVFAPIALLTLLSALAFTSLCAPLYFLPCFIIAICYFLLLTCESAKIARRHQLRPGLAALIFVTVLVIHLGIATGLTTELFLGPAIDGE